MRPPRLLAPVALAAVALGAAGCGSDPIEAANLPQVRSVVERFAAAGDASACDLLTDTALENVYGGFKPNPAAAKKACVKASTAFKGEPVSIQKAAVIDNMTAKVNALSKDGKFTYSITVRRPGKTWLIDQINQYKVRP
jgi:ABC-type glycerol-3-phosphate transport system substrate-binding protein